MAVKRVNVSLDPDIHAQLERIAELEERTLPNLLAFLGRRYLQEKQQDQTQAS